MATYTIIAADATPGPGQINADQTIEVREGDVFIIDPSADKDIHFDTGGNELVNFDVVFNNSNANDFKIDFGDDLAPTVTVADDAALNNVELDASNSEGLTLDVGDNVGLGKLNGSSTGADVITIGDGFTAYADWDTRGGSDIITIGNEATFVDIRTGVGDDTVTIGDDATFEEIHTEAGNDSIEIGDRAVGRRVKGGSDDDEIRSGSGTQIDEVDGGSGSDSYQTQTGGTAPKNMESEAVVCFMQGTMIKTVVGEKRIEDLRAGDLVWTLDAGLKPLRWIGRFGVSAQRLQDDPTVHPVRVRTGAFAPGVPHADLYVSQQHRVLIRSRIAERMFKEPEVLVAAKKIVEAPGVDIVTASGAFDYYHLAFDCHVVVVANGAEMESMLIAPQSLKALTTADRRTLFSDMDGGDVQGQTPARPIIQNHAKIAKLLERAFRNRKDLQESEQGRACAA